MNQDTQWGGLFAYAGSSPVHTVYITAQALDRRLGPLAETRLAVTVERCWDGKLNLLDFSITPSY
jgi:hypothetical protein